MLRGGLNRDAASPLRQASVPAGVALLLVRGILLWIVVPLAFVCRLLLAIPLCRRSVTLDKFLGWVDLNLVAFLGPIVRTPLSWVPVSAMPEVEHRLRFEDPA
jgi:hypothetical protein